MMLPHQVKRTLPFLAAGRHNSTILFPQSKPIFPAYRAQTKKSFHCAGKSKKSKENRFYYDIWRVYLKKVKDVSIPFTKGGRPSAEGFAIPFCWILWGDATEKQREVVSATKVDSRLQR
jgi:hypothetical protein